MINDIKTEYEEERAAKESQRRFSDAFWQKNCGLSPNPEIVGDPMPGWFDGQQITTPILSGWQLCVKCNGEGSVPSNGINTAAQCPVCKGKMIISRLTGLPPVYETQSKL